MAKVLPPLPYDYIKKNFPTTDSWRGNLSSDNWKRRLRGMLGRAEENISPNTEEMIVQFIEELLKYRR